MLLFKIEPVCDHIGLTTAFLAVIVTSISDGANLNSTIDQSENEKNGSGSFLIIASLYQNGEGPGLSIEQ